MKFISYQQQKGYGCDYSIGCGMRVEIIEANSLEKALDKILKLPDNWDEIENPDSFHDQVIIEAASRVLNSERGDQVAQWKLYQIAEEVDLMPLVKKQKKLLDSQLEKIKTNIKDKEDKLKYEELKKKFENQK